MSFLLPAEAPGNCCQRRCPAPSDSLSAGEDQVYCEWNQYFTSYCYIIIIIIIIITIIIIIIIVILLLLLLLLLLLFFILLLLFFILFHIAMLKVHYLTRYYENMHQLRFSKTWNL